jgi:FKBP-type peptidyl-prolyl cis-trans isomerase
MKVRNILLLILPLLLVLGSCSKDDFDPEKQAQQDESTIVKFLADNNITAQRHETGLYYQILAPGLGNIIYTGNTTVSAKYKGRLLNGSVFDQTTANPVSFKLGGVIAGWQIGVPLIQKGGKIRIFIPSALGYGRDGSGAIPANAVLDFDIELVDVN